MTEDAPVPCTQEPSDAAWRRAGEIAAQILENLAERDLRAAAPLPSAASTKHKRPRWNGGESQKGALQMLTEILSIAAPLRVTTADASSQSTVGVGSPAGASGATDRGAAGALAPIALGARRCAACTGGDAA